MRNRIIGYLAIAVLITAVVMGLGFRINHPQTGLSSALGSAKSSLTLYKHGKSAAVGDKVVVQVEGIGPGLGIVKSKTPESLDIDLGATFIRVDSDDVLGKLIAVIPFFGAVLGVVGL